MEGLYQSSLFMRPRDNKAAVLVGDRERTLTTVVKAAAAILPVDPSAVLAHRKKRARLFRQYRPR
jgi:hypothetical protein